MRTPKRHVLIAWGSASDGRKHLLHLAVGNSESEDDWVELYRHHDAARVAGADLDLLRGAPG